MSSGFTPSPTVNTSNEKEWPANLGILDWDTTQIVFTKRSLLEFLKYADVTVDPNFTNIQKLPRYARFGTIEGYSQTAASSSGAQTTSGATTSDAFRPSRRVRTAPGGMTTDIFGIGARDDALANAPPSSGATSSSSVSEALEEASAVEPSSIEDDQESSATTTDTRSRTKVQRSSMGNLWDAPNADDFKPTRRVREMPGGKDSISNLF